jgi:hypothetical protein
LTLTPDVSAPAPGGERPLRSGLHSILTSSHHTRPGQAGTGKMVSSRDRRFVSVEMISRSSARTPPPAFLFPIQRCQRPEPPAGRPHRLTPGGRRRRLSMEAALPCQPAFSRFLRLPGEPGDRRQKLGAGNPEGLPSCTPERVD